MAISMVAAGCNNDPSKDKSKAQVSEAVTTPQAAAPKGAVHFAFGAPDSKVTWVGAKITKKHDGSFGAFTGSIDVVDADPTKSTVTVDIDTSTLSADDPKLTGHLKSADFFDVAKFPHAKFGSTQIKAGGENGATHTVAGNLELHGVTKAISFPATIRLVGDGADVDAEFGINRRDFNIVYPGMPDDLIKDQVLIKLTVRAKKASR